MPVTHYDIDDQWNKQNIAEAQKMFDEEKQWTKQFRKGVHKAYFAMGCPCEDDEAIEVKYDPEQP